MEYVKHKEFGCIARVHKKFDNGDVEVCSIIKLAVHRSLDTTYEGTSYWFVENLLPSTEADYNAQLRTVELRVKVRR